MIPNPGLTLNDRLSSPNKLFECLAAGTPVVGSDFPTMRRIIVADPSASLGAVCDPASAGAIAEAIRSIVSLEPSDVQELRARCLRAAIERWNWQRESEHTPRALPRRCAGQRPPEGRLRRSVKAVPSRWSGILTHGGQSSRSAWRRGLFFPPRGSPANGCGRSASRDMTLRGPPTWVGGVLTAGHRGGWLVAILALVCAPIVAALATWLGMQPIAPGTSVRVTSIPALLTALANNALSEIVVANGTYAVSTAGSQGSNSLWIGSRFAGRTRPITVRAETRGGVTFDGGGAAYFGGLTFIEGAHDQTWDGFNFANGKPTQTGVVVFGSRAGVAAPHHITLRYIRFLSSLRWGGTNGDHTIYFSYAVGGPHDILLEDINVDGSGGLSSALQFYHSDSANRNAWNVTVRRLTVLKTERAIAIWVSSLRNILIDGATITGATGYAVRYEQPGSGTVLANITSTGSGSAASTARPGATRPASRSSTPASTHSRPARAASG